MHALCSSDHVLARLGPGASPGALGQGALVGLLGGPLALPDARQLHACSRARAYLLLSLRQGHGAGGAEKLAHVLMREGGAWRRRGLLRWRPHLKAAAAQLVNALR